MNRYKLHEPIKRPILLGLGDKVMTKSGSMFDGGLAGLFGYVTGFMSNGHVQVAWPNHATTWIAPSDVVRVG